MDEGIAFQTGSPDSCNALDSIAFNSDGMREIKFKSYIKSGDSIRSVIWEPFNDNENIEANSMLMPNEEIIAYGQQFTGFLDKNNKEIYESDIFRVEEDEDNLIYYLVIVWIKEWGMFGTLRVSDEYQAYLKNGADALDEPMFWTYTLEDTASRKFYLCGNIHQNPNLLEP